MIGTMKQKEAFHAKIRWKTSSDSESYRDHQVVFPGKTEFSVSAMPFFKGDAGKINPEEMLVASLSSCQLMSYLYLCRLNQLEVLSYVDEAVGFLSKRGRNRYWVGRIVLRPKIGLSGTKTPTERATAIHLIQEAHEHCFIAQSLRTKVEIEPDFLFFDDSIEGNEK